MIIKKIIRKHRYSHPGPNSNAGSRRHCARVFWRSKRGANDSIGIPEILIDTLPSGWPHPYRTLDYGPEHKLYASLDSTCNDNKLHAEGLRGPREGIPERRWIGTVRPGWRG
jgi:glucose/arabinose dehydrogenase